MTMGFSKTGIPTHIWINVLFYIIYFSENGTFRKICGKSLAGLRKNVLPFGLLVDFTGTEHNNELCATAGSNC